MTTISGLYPRLVVQDAARAIDFYVTALGAKETERHTDPTDGRIVHAALSLGAGTIAVKDESDGDPAPPSLGGSPVILALEVSDADTMADAMIAGGATVVYPITDEDYGRGGRLADPFGHLWMVHQPPTGTP